MIRPRWYDYLISLSINSDQLDNGNNKNALHEAEKVLKKQKDLHAAKVLKCIALHRLGRGDDALNLAKIVADNQPTDENSLQGLSLYFREINKGQEVTIQYSTSIYSIQWRS